MARLLSTIAPERMGHDYRQMLLSSWVTNLSDGIALSAGPLLVASQTRNPALIAAATAMAWLPNLIFGLYAGVLADRLDRKMMIAVANVVRALVLVALSGAIVTDAVSVWIVLGALFLLGAAESFVDTSASTLLPMLVDRSDIGLANARLMFGHITINRLAGPPLGALLFTVGMVWPFLAQIVAVLLGAILVMRIATSTTAVRPVGDVPARSGLRTEIAEGARWVWRHPPIRTLTLTIITFNVTFGAAWSILVLYALERLGLGEIGFGMITTVGAVGGLIGTVIYPAMERRLSLGNIMRVGLVIETSTHFGLALTSSPWVALPIFFVFGAHEAVWGTVATTVRQRAVPTEFQGRVTSVYMTGVHGGLVVGAVVGGLVADRFGVTGPFWFAFAGSCCILAAIWRRLDLIAHSADPDSPTVSLTD